MVAPAPAAPKIVRHSYTLALEITPTTPLTHGKGNEGNEQILRTSEYLIRDEFGNLERYNVPEVSGAAIRATLREHAVADFLELLAIEEGTVSQDRLRLLLKGGRNDAGGASVSTDDARRMRRLAPLLTLWGSMDGGFGITGSLSVEPARVWCAELVEAGLIPRVATPIRREGAEGDVKPALEFFDGIEPPPVHLTLTRLQNYRHDMRTSETARYLPGETLAAIEDRSAARAEIAKPSAEVRRAANESMPYAFQAIAPGTPMLSVLRLRDAGPVEIAVLKRALVRWIQHGAFLGGGRSAGRGACKVEIKGWIAKLPGLAVAPGTAIDLGSEDPHSAPYLSHLEGVADEARSWLCEDKAAAKEAKKEARKGGKKPKASDGDSA